MAYPGSHEVAYNKRMQSDKVPALKLLFSKVEAQMSLLDGNLRP